MSIKIKHTYFVPNAKEQDNINRLLVEINQCKPDTIEEIENIIHNVGGSGWPHLKPITINCILRYSEQRFTILSNNLEKSTPLVEITF